MRIPILLAASAFLLVCVCGPFRSGATNQSSQVDHTAFQQTTSVVKDNKILIKSEVQLLEPEFVPGEVLVKFRSSVNVTQLIQGQKTSKGQLQFPASVKL